MEATAATTDERALVAALRARDEAAFVALVNEHGAAMRRFALTFVRTAVVADEVVQGGFTGVAPTLAQYRIGPLDADLRCTG